MNKKWWKEAVVYQIYPRSFKDTNGDGVGDIRGVIEKLDYLKFLGIDVIWLCPIYKSPNDDNGYDISDYRDIMQEFGTMKDFDELLEEAHRRGIKILLDLVVNHSSDEHNWFVESRKSKDNEYRDYYIWREGKDGKEPNNWGSVFSGSAWQYDEATDMYYLHLFTKKQPDLNWENPKVRKEVQDLVRWWLDKGIDGFRMDVISAISKQQDFPDGPKKEGALYGDFGPYSINGPRVHEFLKELNKEVLSKYDVMTVGETPGATPEIAMNYVGEERDELNMLFQFEHMSLGDGEDGKWSNGPFNLIELKTILSKWQKGLEKGGWNSLYWNNHDQPRIVSRFGDDKKYWKESAKMLGTCLHMLQGTPYIYQGEEIGMTNVAFENLEDYKDVEIFNAYKELVQIKGKDHDEMMKAIYERGRDNARTPMQWNASENAGFTQGTPWIKLNPNYKEINVESQINDEHSILNYYRKLIKIRKENEAVVYGQYDLILDAHEEIYAYTRTLENEKLLVICNFSQNTPEFNLPQHIEFSAKDLIISNYEADEKEGLKEIVLKPYECRVYKLIK